MTDLNLVISQRVSKPGPEEIEFLGVQGAQSITPALATGFGRELAAA
jgi:hypothetical protein